MRGASGLSGTGHACQAVVVSGAFQLHRPVSLALCCPAPHPPTSYSFGLSYAASQGSRCTQRCCASDHTSVLRGGQAARLQRSAKHAGELPSPSPWCSGLHHCPNVHHATGMGANTTLWPGLASEPEAAHQMWSSRSTASRASSPTARQHSVKQLAHCVRAKGRLAVGSLVLTGTGSTHALRWARPAELPYRWVAAHQARAPAAHLAAAPPPRLQQLDRVVVAREARDGSTLRQAWQYHHR